VPFVQRSGLGTLWTNGGQVNALNTNIGGIKTSGTIWRPTTPSI
jgi:hypothetical protein